MSAIRRFQTVFALLIVGLLASPALAACCVWSPAPMACCEKTEGDRLVATCCVTSPQAPRQQPPASVTKLSKLEPKAPVASAALPPIAVAAAQPIATADRVAGPPGSHPLYLRLSVIRR
jgi:hypothetical protein